MGVFSPRRRSKAGPSPGLTRHRPKAACCAGGSPYAAPGTNAPADSSHSRSAHRSAPTNIAARRTTRSTTSSREVSDWVASATWSIAVKIQACSWAAR